MNELSVSIVSVRFISVLLNFCAMWFMSLLGSEVIAAGAIISSVLMFVNMASASLVISTGVFIAQAYGGKNYFEIGERLRASFLLGLIIGVLAMLLLRHIGIILIFFGQKRHIVDLVEKYIHAYYWSIVPNLWITNLIQFLFGISKVRLAVFWSILSFLILLTLGYSLIFGKFGLSNLGIEGMGYAYTIMYLFVAILMVAHLIIYGYHKKYNLFVCNRFLNFKYLIELLNFGLLTFLQIATEIILISATTFIIGSFGELALIARQVNIQINSIIFVISYGLTQANTILISQINGSAVDFKIKMILIRKLGTKALLCVAFFGVIVGAVYFLASKWIIRFYIDTSLPINAEIVKLTTLFLIIAAVSQFFDNLRALVIGLLRGISDINVPIFISIFTVGIFSIFMGYLFAFIFKLGAVGVLIGCIPPCVFGTLFLVRRFYKLTEVSLGDNKD